MKRMFIAVLLAGLLCGCASQPLQPSAANTETSIPPETGIYAENSVIEADTAGAIREFSLTGSPLSAVRAMGKDVLLFSSSNESTTLTRVSPENGAILANAALPVLLDAASELVQVTDSQVGYYDAARHAVVLLNAELREEGCLSLTQSLSEDFLLSPMLDALYYTNGLEIRAIDLRTGSSRLVNQQSSKSVTSLQGCLGGKILFCRIADADGAETIAFLAADTGKILEESTAPLTFLASGSHYYSERMDGSVLERLFGALDASEPQLLSLGLGTPAAVLEDAVLFQEKADTGTLISLFNLSNGKIAARLSLPDSLIDPHSWAINDSGVWFLAQNGGETKLYCWDISRSATGDNASYATPRYTAEQPDEAGLTKCRETADALEETYGVAIHLWQDALTAPSENATLTPEYQTSAIESGLTSLEDILARFPEGFFSKLCENTASGKLHISLVRSIESGLPSIQYWAGTDAYIVLAIGEGMEQAFCHDVSYPLDNYIIANCLDYDNWEQENPSGFDYDLSYDLYQEHMDSAYLTGDDPAFLDAFSMTYPREDRARILQYAMTELGQGRFDTDNLQEKLKTICVAIRDAFDWEDSPMVFPWEQYLHEPLAADPTA